MLRKGKDTARLKETYALQSADGVTKLSDYAQIPVFNNTTAETQKALEKIVNDYPFHNPNAAKTFSDDALHRNNDMNKSLFQLQQSLNFTPLSAPLQKAAYYIGQDNIKDINNRADKIYKTGKDVIKPGFLKRAFSHAIGVFSEEKAERMREPDSIIRLQYDMNTTLVNFFPLKREIEIAALGLPGMQKKVTAAYQEALENLPLLSLYISAGKEILNRYHKDILPKAKQDMSITDYSKLETAAKNFSRKLGVLNNKHTNALKNVHVLNIMKEAVDSTIDTVRFILEDESKVFEDSLKTKSQTLQTLECLNIIKAFSQKTQDSITSSRDTIKQHTKSLESGKANPDQVAAIIDDLEETRRHIDKAVKILPQIEEMREKLATQLEKTSKDFLDNQIEHTGKVLEFANK